MAREDWLLNSTLDRSRRWRIRLVLTVAATLCSGEMALAAPQVVTVCGRSDAAGGLNLATAIATGGDIVIRCPAGQQEIQVVATLNARGIVHVDGEGKVTLRGPVAGPLFTSDISLSLSRLTVTNPRTAATGNAPGAGTIILGPKSSIELDGVTTQDSVSAYVVQRLSARDSAFLRNGEPAQSGTFSAVVNADSIQLQHVTFEGNFDHPTGGGSAPEAGRPALSRSVVIEDSVFTGNRSTLLLTDARVSIRRTRFEGNGIPQEKWGGTWDCCGGAITLVRSDAELVNAEFRSNNTSGFGGAIYAMGTRLRIAGSVFEKNKARAGGAVMFWGRPPKVNIWSSGDSPEPVRLELRRTQFRGNSATAFGGALLFAGAVDGEAVLLQANVSGTAGGAIADWRAGELPEPYGGVFDALVASTQLGPADSMMLARPILVDNRAGSRGAALALGAATVAIGNGLIARNQSAAAGGGAVSGVNLTLVNTTLADNPAGGFITAAGSTVRLGNTILLRNAGFNCKPGGTLLDMGRNLQYPTSDCGAAAEARNPDLDGQYAPGLVSVARGTGNTGLCAADPQVRVVDLFGKPRLARGRCDRGAIEQPLPEAMASALGLGSGREAVPRLLCLMVVLILTLFLLGLLWAVLRRRRRRFRPESRGTARA